MGRECEIGTYIVKVIVVILLCGPRRSFTLGDCWRSAGGLDGFNVRFARGEKAVVGLLDVFEPVCKRIDILKNMDNPNEMPEAETLYVK